LVQDQIRYVLLAMNTGALVPATADQTWQRRYGDCKAKTTLLLALLRELGIDAEAVAVNSAMGDGVDQLLPAISVFDHVLVRAQVGGRTYWLDGTRLGDRQLDQLPVPGFRWGLPLRASGSELVQIEPPVLTEPLLVQEIELDASAGADAPAPFRGKVVFRGDAATGMRFSLDNMDVTQRDQGMRSFWRNKFDDLQVTSVASSYDEASGSLTLTAEGTLRLDWWEENFFEIEDMRLGFPADFTRPEGTDAQAPYVVAFPDYSVYRATVKLPNVTPGFGISGDNINQKLAGWEYKRKASISNALFRAEASMRSLVPEISAEEARAAEASLRKLSDNVLYLTKPPKLATAAELQAQAGKPLGSAAAYIDRGADMIDRSLYELAIGEFTSAIKLEPGNALAWEDRGYSYANLKRFDEARADLAKAVELNPKSASALRNLGSAMFELGQTADAIRQLGKSLEMEEDSWTRERRAQAYLAARNASSAAEDLIAVLRTEPGRLSLFSNHARDLLRDNRASDVITMANAVLKARAGPSEGALLSSTLFRMSGDDTRARAIAMEAIARTPTAELFTLLGDLDRDPDKSAGFYKQAVDVDPKSLPALSRLVSLQFGTGRNADALSTLDRIEAVSGQGLYWHSMRGQILAKMGEAERARQSFSAARALARNAADFSNLCQAQGSVNFDFELALQDCGSATAKDPDCLACIKMETALLAAAGQHGNAIAAYDKALARRPRDAELIYGRGIAKVKSGKDAEGEADIEVATRIDPKVAERFRILEFPR
jgi:Flp pilus assembly protein TadD